MASSQISRSDRIVGLWLWLTAALVFLLVVVGGATRLTESGLSIVEWRPVTGSIPPVSAQSWQAEFEKYKAIPQYTEVNRGMSLEEFKTIYWWEWAHRFLGRLVGAAFFLPFLVFLWRGWIRPEFRWPLWGIFALGGLQGAVGWWMVTSGLAERVSVSQYRLAFHLTLACVIYALLVWYARRHAPDRPVHASPRHAASAAGIVVLVLIQIYLGALVAGTDAGMVFNTWPLIDGHLVPEASRLFFETPLWRNFFENTLTVQFVHRMCAYLLWSCALLHMLDVWRSGRRGEVLAGAAGVAMLVTVQAGIGIATLLEVSPLGLSLLHQAMAVAVLTVALVHAERLSGRRTAAQARFQPAAGPAAGRSAAG